MSDPKAPGYVWRPTVAPPVVEITPFWQTATSNVVQVVSPPTASIPNLTTLRFGQVPAQPPATFVPPPTQY